MAQSRFFYKNLIKHSGSLLELLESPNQFVTLPDDWAVVMVDVKGSTEAVRLGFHHDVNLAATGAIVAAQNRIREIDPKIRVPYFFGGDGATFLVPELVLEELLEVLERYKLQTANRLNLTLKVGAHSVRGIYKNQHSIRIAKFAVNDLLTLPIILGTGIKYAERIIKDAIEGELDEPSSLATVNLEGMECRWDEILPPEEEEKVVCLVAFCKDDARQGQVYSHVLRAIDQSFGNYDERQPISLARLKLDLAIGKIRREMEATMAKFSAWDLFRNWLFVLIGPIYFRISSDGKAYLNSLTQLTHTLMFDGTLNCIISGKQSCVVELVNTLETLEAKGDLTFGIHVTRASVMSCYVINRKRDHAHFVDGTDGGFTEAAKVFKAKLSKSIQ